MTPGEWLYSLVRLRFLGRPPWDRLPLEDKLAWEAIECEMSLAINKALDDLKSKRTWWEILEEEGGDNA